MLGTYNYAIIAVLYKGFSYSLMNKFPEIGYATHKYHFLIRKPFRYCIKDPQKHKHILKQP